MTERERMAEHIRQREIIRAALLTLVNAIEAAALAVHGEMEDIHARIEQLELIHNDPAHHGKDAPTNP
jgi:hypothetical protein